MQVNPTNLRGIHYCTQSFSDDKFGSGFEYFLTAVRSFYEPAEVVYPDYALFCQGLKSIIRLSTVAWEK